MKEYKIRFHTGAVIRLKAAYVKTTDTHFIFYNENGDEISTAWKWNSDVIEPGNENDPIELFPMSFVKAGSKIPGASQKPRSAK